MTKTEVKGISVEAWTITDHAGVTYTFYDQEKAELFAGLNDLIVCLGRDLAERLYDEKDKWPTLASIFNRLSGLL